MRKPPWIVLHPRSPLHTHTAPLHQNHMLSSTDEAARAGAASSDFRSPTKAPAAFAASGAPASAAQVAPVGAFAEHAKRTNSAPPAIVDWAERDAQERRVSEAMAQLKQMRASLTQSAATLEKTQKLASQRQDECKATVDKVQNQMDKFSAALDGWTAKMAGGLAGMLGQFEEVHDGINEARKEAFSTSSKVEHFDSAEVLNEKVLEMANRFRRAKHAIAFTGAGISTAAGVPDYRSGVNTVLDTGAGLWTRAAYKKQAKAGRAGVLKNPVKTVSMQKACPTFTHMALRTLIEKGMLKFLISQNIDGLHLRSGVPRAHLSELHGNRNLEQCVRCKAEYLRDHNVRTSKKVHDHVTGRTCDNPKCGGALQDTIINFGESLPERDWDASFIHAGKADFCLALGSSLTVTPAADLPEQVGDRKGSDLFIVNLQNTPLDRYATKRLNGKCDEVMKLFMAELGVEVLPWKLHKGIQIDVIEVESGLGSATAATLRKDNLQVQRARNPSLRVSSDQVLSAARTRRSSSVGRMTSEKKTFEVRVSGINVESRTPYSQFTVVELIPPAAAAPVSDSAASTSSSCKVPQRGSLPPVSRVQSTSLRENETSTKFAIRAQSAAEIADYTVKCSFHGHYQEPLLEMPCRQGVYKLELDVSSVGKWEITPLME